VDDPQNRRIAIIAGAGLLGFFILNGVYQAGVNAGLSGDRNWGHGPGFFPPFPLILLGILVYIGWKRRWFGGGPSGPGGPGGPGGRGPGGGPPRFFEEWHRRAHEAGREQPPAPPASQAAPGNPWTPAPPAPPPADASGANPTPPTQPTGYQTAPGSESKNL
jgi:hypothetical protein